MNTKKSRKKIPIHIQTDLLTRSARRCCICFHIENDYTEKQGQIAHLDDDPSNNDIDNLAFLCLSHHDTYDSPTSQSKNYQMHEIKKYREELYNYNLSLKGSVQQKIENEIIIKNISFSSGRTNSKNQFVSLKKDNINREDRDFLIVNNKYYHISDWGLLKWLIGINKKVKITNLEKSYVDENYFDQYEAGEENLDQWNFGDYIDIKMDDEFYYCSITILNYLRQFKKSILITEIKNYLIETDNLNYNEDLLNRVMHFLKENNFITDGKTMHVMSYNITPLGIKASQEGLYKYLPKYIVKEKWLK